VKFPTACIGTDGRKARDFCVAQVHLQLQTQFSNLSDDYSKLQAELDDQADANAKLQAQLQKAAADAQALKGKYEKDITVISEEFDNSKLVYSLNHFQSNANYTSSFYSIYLICRQGFTNLFHCLIIAC